MTKTFDIAIAGSGFAGSLLALITRRLGRSVVLLERGHHPRFAIGESSTPLANLLLEELALRYDLPRLLPLCKWGTWQRDYPHVAVGLKRGFSFFHQDWDQPFANSLGRSDQLLVAASPHDGIADTHWYRPDFDQFLAREAQESGAELWEETTLHNLALEDGRAVIKGEREGQPFDVRARFVVDATGPRGFLHHALGLQERPLPHLPRTQALFSHFRGVRRLDDGILSLDGTPPYPIDDAALHHVFDGGWIWVLRFNNGITSAGVVARDDVAVELGFASGGDGEKAWHRLLEHLPTVRAQFEGAQAVEAFRHIKRVSFHSNAIAGPGWALLPSAAGFIDPLLSTGFPLTLLGIMRLAAILEKEKVPSAEQLANYENQTRAELLAAEHLVAALYTHMDDFPEFKALSLLYFAAASFSETARRLNRPELAGGFLLHDHPRFGPESRACLERALQTHGQSEDVMNQVQRIIEPFDVAGLTNPARHAWYPVDADDLCRAKDKLGVDTQAIETLLERAGFFAGDGERP